MICDNKIRLHYLNSSFQTDILEGNLTSLIPGESKNFPEVGEALTHENLIVEIIEADEERIISFKITKRNIETGEQ